MFRFIVRVFKELIIVFVIHESSAAKVSHLYSGCQVFWNITLLKMITNHGIHPMPAGLPFAKVPHR